MKFYIQTFGCQMNENDSELISGLLSSAGHQPVSCLDQAEIIVVNTCCVRESAENRALGYIGSLKKIKHDKPQTIICVTGCMMQKPGVAELFQRSYRHVGLLLGTFAACRIPQYAAQYAADSRPIVDVAERYRQEELTRTTQEALSHGERSWQARININYGCNNFCSYCIVPYVRGRERSRALADILSEARALAQGGVKEIELLGQNVNSYGRDFMSEPEQGRADFAALLTALDQVDGLQRIRYMTSHPRDLDESLVSTISRLQHVCHHFHLPVQSGCDRLLQLMNRGYTTSQYKYKLDLIRSYCPDAVITTDLIVGFPGETDRDFQQTLDFVKECEFDAAYTFLYSRRSGTPAAEMEGQVEDSVKKERLQRLMAVQDPISLRINQAMVGKCYEVMLEGASKNDPHTMSGRTEGNKIVILPQLPGKRAGDRLSVKIIQAHTWNLLGESIDGPLFLC